LKRVVLDVSSTPLPDNSLQLSQELDEEGEKKENVQQDEKDTFQSPHIPILHFKWEGEGENDAFTVIYSHGNAEDIGQSIHWMKKLKNKLKANVVSYDYVGYGTCKGRPSEDKCYKSILTVYNYLVKSGVKSEKIILFGRSLGSGPTVHLAFLLSKIRRKIAGVILQSPLESAIRVVSTRLATLPVDMFENIKKIDKIRCPIFIAHGTMDEVVPYVHGQHLQAKVSPKYLWRFSSINGAGHNNIESDDYCREYVATLQEFCTYLKDVKSEQNSSLDTYPSDQNELVK